MKNWIIGLAAALASVGAAHAERPVCNTLTNEDGLISQIGAVVDPTLDRMLIQVGPLFAPIELDPNLSFRPVADGRAELGIYLYLTGREIEGKDWRAPGGVELQLAGFGLQWPVFENQYGQRFPHVVTKLESGAASSTSNWDFEEARLVNNVAQIGIFHPSLLAEHPNKWLRRPIYSSEYQSWMDALTQGEPLTFTLDIYPAGATPFAVTKSRWPHFGSLNARVARDVGAFRKAVASGKCESGLRNSIP